MTTSKTLWRIVRFSRKIWVRAALYSLLAVAAALLALVLKPYVPDDLPTAIGADAVDSLLTILGSSMLAVTTFTLNIMVSSYASAAGAATPRATGLLIEDDTSQSVLATFLGSFLYSLIGLIILRTGLYGAHGRVVLFGFTVFVILTITVTFLRWINRLSTLGRIQDTLSRVEDAAREALNWRVANPYFGGMPLQEIPADAEPIYSRAIGYVSHVDAGALSSLASDFDGDLYLIATPGAFVEPSSPVAYVRGKNPPKETGALDDCITIENERTYSQDPRFGVIVLSEIASRALSPAVNDPGTAIDVLGRLVRVLSDLGGAADEGMPLYENLYVPRLRTHDLFNDAFRAIGRDGAGLVEVAIRLQKSLRMLARTGIAHFESAATEQSQIALHHAEKALAVDEDKAIVRALAASVAAQASRAP
ncbi:MAG: DUF2254 domain-containing protein [Hyphomicrobiales bacterium]|nr:DUF2254 domain-containing protein [Hyphomicrobiales bacterium]